ncbi:Rho GDP-dissociation inhibitor 1 [Camellia lanceoleosa]|uniref:Rho GDP-dissociation inhibitor 1 n=1 Tax=Camellia lanceoleosa TaxID=1840588 RepID=A0ACC0GT23_9ERIC|nr:Rho GDP-dissociation inhibitor 1 [Camellia lanceoleosa]
MGLDEDNVTYETKPTQPIQSHSRQPSETSCYATKDEVEGNKEDEEEKDCLQLGPICSIKEHLEKDKDDESLRRWKEQLLGSVNVNAVEETLALDIQILGLSILCPGRPDLVLEIPANGDPKGMWFTLKEDTCFHLRFSIQVSNNIVSSLRYINTVWKTIDRSKQMVGTFRSQAAPYMHEMPKETTPSKMTNLTLSNVMSDRASATSAAAAYRTPSTEDIEVTTKDVAATSTPPLLPPTTASDTCESPIYLWICDISYRPSNPSDLKSVTPPLQIHHLCHRGRHLRHETSIDRIFEEQVRCNQRLGLASSDSRPPFRHSQLSRPCLHLGLRWFQSFRALCLSALVFPVLVRIV